MGAKEVIQTQKIGIIGVGNLGQAILNAFIDSGLVPRENIRISNRTEKKLQRVAEDLQVRAVNTNEQLVDESDIVFIGVKPQDLYQTIEPIASVFGDDHIVMSLAAGIPLKSLRSLLPNVRRIFRVMPNTAARTRRSVIAYTGTEACAEITPWVEELLGTMGLPVCVEDGEMMEALTVAASSGIGFIFELMIYWQEWLEERGIDSETARRITVQVFAGASSVAESAAGTSLAELQRKVVSLKGVTAAGLDSMRELEIERTLRYSFEKAALRDKELGLNWLRQV